MTTSIPHTNRPANEATSASPLPDGWEMVIGIETHVQLATASKIFSSSATAFGAQPNAQASVVDLAYPGVLPRLNSHAVALALRFGLAVQADIPEVSVFARKNYFYPDLPKGYQISQFEQPIVVGGRVRTIAGNSFHDIALTRAHLEEDAGKSTHEKNTSHIDLNRAGTPLLEIVSEPVMHSPEEAGRYGRTLHALVTWLGICDGNLQEGSFRMDANVSVRRQGEKKLGTRCEIKNLNSFRFLEKAILFEALRHIEVLEEGGHIRQETRLFDPEAGGRGETRTMRSKEDAEDYRYFPDPDLLPVVITPAMRHATKAAMPKLPEQLADEWQQSFGWQLSDCAGLLGDKHATDYFLQALAALNTAAETPACAQALLNWVNGALAAWGNQTGLSLTECPCPPTLLAQVVRAQVAKQISHADAKQLVQALLSKEITEAAILAERIAALQQQNALGAGQLTGWVQTVLQANPKAVAEYLAGKDKALNALVGQVMKLAQESGQGKPDPASIMVALKEAVSDMV